jgi:hypothetical protein
LLCEDPGHRTDVPAEQPLGRVDRLRAELRAGHRRGTRRVGQRARLDLAFAAVEMDLVLPLLRVPALAEMPETRCGAVPELPQEIDISAARQHLPRRGEAHHAVGGGDAVAENARTPARRRQHAHRPEVDAHLQRKVPARRSRAQVPGRT